MSSCIFCRIAARQVPSTIVYEDEMVLAFKDINPQAPVHILVIPKEHIPSLDDVEDRHANALARILLVIKDLARGNDLGEGYRVVNNCGPRAGQTVHHLHFHLIGGRDMNWPPG